MIEKAVRIGLANLLLLGVKVLVGPFLVDEPVEVAEEERPKLRVCR